MSERKALAAGIALLASGAIWTAFNWYLQRRQNNLQRLPDKNAVQGYYFVEGLLESNSPIVHDHQKYAKVLVKTSQNVQINGDPYFNYMSSANFTIIQQVNHNQKLTIDSIDVSEFMESFPLTTIREDTSGNYIYGLLIEHGRWRVSGWYDGTKLCKVTNSDISYEHSSTDANKKSSGINIRTAIMTIGATILLNRLL